MKKTILKIGIVLTLIFISYRLYRHQFEQCISNDDCLSGEVCKSSGEGFNWCVKE